MKKGAELAFGVGMTPVDAAWLEAVADSLETLAGSLKLNVGLPEG